MFVRTSMDSEVKMPRKITSAVADSRIYSFTKMMTLYMCIVEVTIFLSVSLFFPPNVVVMSTLRPAGLCRISRWTKNSAEQAEFIENYFYESLASSRHSVDLEFNEEVMKPERFTEELDHAGFNPDTMRVSKWYQKTTLKSDVSHISSFQSHKWHFCWNKFDVRKRACRRWWRKALDEDRWYDSSIARTSF